MIVSIFSAPRCMQKVLLCIGPLSKPVCEKEAPNPKMSSPYSNGGLTKALSLYSYIITTNNIRLIYHGISEPSTTYRQVIPSYSFLRGKNGLNTKGQFGRAQKHRTTFHGSRRTHDRPVPHVQHPLKVKTSLVEKSEALQRPILKRRGLQTFGRVQLRSVSQ